MFYYYLAFNTVVFLPVAFQTAWQGLACSGEQYVLRYESDYLLQMGQGLDYLLNVAVNAVAAEALKYTILSGRY